MGALSPDIYHLPVKSTGRQHGCGKADKGELEHWNKILGLMIGELVWYPDKKTAAITHHQSGILYSVSIFGNLILLRWLYQYKGWLIFSVKFSNLVCCPWTAYWSVNNEHFLLVFIVKMGSQPQSLACTPKTLNSFIHICWVLNYFFSCNLPIKDSDLLVVHVLRL